MEILDAEGSLPLPRNLNLSQPPPPEIGGLSFILSFIMADIHQQLEDVRKEIQEAKIEKSAALAKGDTSYAAALVAQLTSLQNKELFLMNQQQNQGEQR